MHPRPGSILLSLLLVSTVCTGSLVPPQAGNAAAGTVAVPAEPALERDPVLPDPVVAEVSRASGSQVDLEGARDPARIVTASSAGAIPAAALAAYQRAETIINAADRGCRLPWQLIAAIGRVESDHGRFAGSVLDEEGVARPRIVGVSLDGRNHTALVLDTDGGLTDGDLVHDRAVGPLQFIPSTWAVAGVDADGDGRRNPQDIDDAALAAAVYLCSGADDLATAAGQRRAVYRYNHSAAYVDLVLSLMDAYAAGDFSSTPGGTIVAPTQGALPELHVAAQTPPSPEDGDPRARDAGLEQPAISEPTDEDDQPSGRDDTGAEPDEAHLTVAQAKFRCVLDGLDQLLQVQAFRECVDGLTNP